jgi:uncharacterized OB-fold protein
VITPLAPVPTDTSLPFWEAAREHRLIVQSCTACGRLQFPPLPMCSGCTADGLEWRELSGRGRVITWTRTHQQYHPALAAQLPYTVLLVELAEQPGLLLYGNLRPAAADVTVNLEVSAVFEDNPDGWTLIHWRAH